MPDVLCLPWRSVLQPHNIVLQRDSARIKAHSPFTSNYDTTRCRKWVWIPPSPRPRMCTSETAFLHLRVVPFRVQSSWKIILIRLDVLLLVKIEWEFGEKWISNIKRECGGGWGNNPLGSESGPQKPPCARAQPWNQPDPIDSVYLARLQVKAIGNLGEIWRGLWIRRGREREKKKWAKK